MRTDVMRTQVAVVGAGPAGLVLAHLLHLQGIDSVVVERRSRESLEQRIRAGMLEAPTVALLREIGVADRLDREGLRHHGFFLRFGRRTHHLELGTAERTPVNYGQHELVKDLIATRIDTGRPLVFGAQDVRVTDVDSTAPQVQWRTAEGSHTIAADVVAGCDGQHGVTRRSLPAGATTTTGRSYPFAWLGILARSRPALPEPVYCAHEDGLSLHSMRGPHLTRQYLQVPAGTRLPDWSDERIWAELTRRSASDDHPDLERGEIIDRLLTGLRSTVVSPMQYGRVFLVGDAAHIVPPTGAKGLNAAVADACALAHAIGAFYAGVPSHLEAYSATCLPRIWQAELFSWSLTTLLHRIGEDPFDHALQRARLDRLVTSPAAAAELGEAYVGLPFPTPWAWAG